MNDDANEDDEFVLSCAVAEEGEEGDGCGVGVLVNVGGFVGGDGWWLLDGRIDIDFGRDCGLRLVGWWEIEGGDTFADWSTVGSTVHHGLQLSSLEVFILQL